MKSVGCDLLFPLNVHVLSSNARLVVLEDEEAVIQVATKQRRFSVKCVPLIHRVDLDLFCARLKCDNVIVMHYVGTTEQIRDMCLKGWFRAMQWGTFLQL